MNFSPCRCAAADSQISIRPLNGAAAFFIASGEAAYATSIGVNPELNTRIVRYAYSSLTTPTTLYDYDIRTGEQVLLKRDPVLGSFDPKDYATEFLLVPARDGAQIPVSLVYRLGFARNGANPLLQYGYGAYGLSMDRSFIQPGSACWIVALSTPLPTCAAARKWAARGTT